MNILIIGAGKAGSYLAQLLMKEGHDVTVVDKNERVVNQISNTLDVIGCVGNGATYPVLRSAGADKCDVAIACTLSDEINLLSCLAAHRLGAKHTIARVRNPEYSDQLVAMKDDLSLSMAINPERAVAAEIARILRFPSATHVELFAHGRVELVSLRLDESDVFNGVMLRDLSKKFGVKVLICAVARGGKVMIPGGDFVLQSGDEIYLTGAPNEVTKMFRKAKIGTDSAKNVMVAGGSRIAYYLAKQLEKEAHMNVKIIERDEARCVELAELLPCTTILNGDVADHELLGEEGINNMDAFVALTGLDEGNILSSLYADMKKVPKIIAKVNNVNLVELVQGSELESIITPKIVTSNLILSYVRALEARNPDGNALTVYRFVGGLAEMLEFRVSKDDTGSYTNVPLTELKTKKNVLIAAIVRRGRVIIPGGADCIMPGDYVLVVTTNEGFNGLSDILEA